MPPPEPPGQAPTQLARLAAAHGVSLSYEPAPGRRVEVPQETVVSVLAALGVDASTPRAARAALEQHEWDGRRLLPPTVVLRSAAHRGTAPHPGGSTRHQGSAPEAAPAPLSPLSPLSSLSRLPDGTVLRVVTEDGQTLDWGPGTALPLGVHTLFAHAPDERSAHSTLVVAPERCPAPRARPGAARGYGLLVQLYSLLSGRSWGMGDLADLRELAAWAGRGPGADFVQLNPLHSAVPGGAGAAGRTDPSPYRPSSRRFPDPVHLRIEEIPEYAYLGPGERAGADALLGRAAAAREAVLSGRTHIDRDAVWALKSAALELVRTVPLAPGRRAAYDDFRAERGRPLEDHATWCALAEVHGADWRAWPAGLDDPRSDRTGRARDEYADRVDFHTWAAWLTDCQLAAAQRAAREAGMAVGLVHDLAVGVHPSGADAWAHQDALAQGISIGAPPDRFTARGQDWGLPPWRPDALARSGYGPYREVLAGLFRHAGALRLDHVMGHSRLWWIPEDRPPTEGTYVRYDTEAMHGVLALQAHRAGAAVIGEDLGTVEPGVRQELAARRMLGTSVLWFERAYGQAGSPPLPPGDWRTDCLATATTHDLPPTAARLTGAHVELREQLGLLGRPEGEERAAEDAELGEWLALFARLGLLPEGPSAQEAESAGIKAVYRFLARTPARMVGVWLPDTVGDRRAQNVPGTTVEYPNWCLPVADAQGRPLSLEELTASERARALLTEVREHLTGGPRPHNGPPGR